MRLIEVEGAFGLSGGYGAWGKSPALWTGGPHKEIRKFFQNAVNELFLMGLKMGCFFSNSEVKSTQFGQTIFGRSV